MIRFEILLNGKTLCEAGVSEEDQLEAALVKLLESDQPILNVTVFDPSSKNAENFLTWKTEVLNVGDEVTIKLSSGEKESKSYVNASENESSESEVESTMFCSFCSKGNFEVQKFIAGNNAYICDECIELCHDMAEDEKT